MMLMIPHDAIAIMAFSGWVDVGGKCGEREEEEDDGSTNEFG